MDNKEKLKPCPFCGGKSKAFEWYLGYVVKCIVCDIRTFCGSKVKVIKAWNRRAKEQNQ